MKIIILGAGKRGLRLAKCLSEEKKDVVLIDSKENSVQSAMSRIDCIAYKGSGINLEDLSDSGMEDADAFVALTGDDEVNLVASAMVRHEFNVPMTIASIRNTSYTGSTGSTSNLMGISHIVNTDFEVASAIVDEIERGVFTDMISFHDSRLVIYNVVVGANPEFCNISVMELGRKIEAECLIVAINRNNQSIIPSGSTMVLPQDTVSIVVKPEGSAKALRFTGKPRIKPKRIVIIGATQITRLILRMFGSADGTQLAVVERDLDICREFEDEFPNVLVINGNITDDSIFQEENLGSYDMLIAMTDSDELNVIIASYCKQEGLNCSMAVIRSNNSYMRLARHMGIDSIISAQEVTVDSITRFLHGTHVASIHSLFDGKIEVFEYVIGESSKALGKQLKDFNMHGKGIVAGITKPSRTTVIPNGSYSFESGDILVLIVHQANAVSITRMFD